MLEPGIMILISSKTKGTMILAKPILYYQPFARPVQFRLMHDKHLVLKQQSNLNDSLCQLKGYNSSILPTK